MEKRERIARGLAAVCFVGLSGCGIWSTSPERPPAVPDDQVVLFATSASEVTGNDGFFSLGYIVATAQASPTFHLLLVGHADASGASDKNRELCFKRARAVRKQLLAHGVDEKRIVVAAPRELGSDTNASLSRRVDVIFFDPVRDDPAKRAGYAIDLDKEKD